MKSWQWSGWLAAAVLCLCSPARAITLSPTSIEIEGDDRGPLRVSVTAPQTSDLALDLEILERRVEGGAEQLVPATSAAFELFPPQLLVPAGHSAEITMRWVGAAPKAVSRSFYLVAEQLVIEARADRASNDVQFVTRIHLPVHVGSGGRPDLQVGVQGDAPDRRLSISNTGARYARLAACQLKVLGRDGSVRLVPGAEIARLARRDAVLPGASVVIDPAALGIEADEGVVGLVDRK